MIFLKLIMIYDFFLGKIGLLFYSVFDNKLILNSNVKFKKIPSIIILFNSKIVLQEGVLLNSSNNNYHINMFNGVKLMADGNQAEIVIGKNSRIHGTCIHAKKKIIIGENCLIAANCQIIDSNAHDLQMNQPSNRLNTIDEGKDIEIGNNVWIGAGTTILGGTTIGAGSVVSANSVIKGNIPPNCIFGGNPASIIKQY
jgi:acetyltransferase-like isoleucine patch superfamily enzyme